MECPRERFREGEYERGEVEPSCCGSPSEKKEKPKRKPDIKSRGAQTDGSLCSEGKEVPPTTSTKKLEFASKIL